MSVERGKNLCCDTCGKASSTVVPDYEADAILRKQTEEEEDWRSVHVRKKEWLDFCPGCVGTQDMTDTIVRAVTGEENE